MRRRINPATAPPDTPQRLGLSGADSARCVRRGAEGRHVASEMNGCCCKAEGTYAAVCAIAGRLAQAGGWFRRRGGPGGSCRETSQYTDRKQE